MTLMIKIFCFIAIFLGTLQTGFSQKSKRLIKNLNELQYDSVKVFHFNCRSDVDLVKFGLLNDETVIDENQTWAYTVSSTGEVISKNDIKNICKALLNNDRQLGNDDPNGCYQPRMGIVFYNKDLANATIDVCLECDSMKLRIFDSGKIKYYEMWGVLSAQSEKYFTSLCLKYKLPCCSSN